MTQQQRSLPIWILIVSAIFALMELGASVMFIISPESMEDTVDLNAKGVDFLILMWASRQFALGVILAFATIKRSSPMLTLAYIFLLVMFAADLCIGVAQHDSSLYIGAGVMCLIASTMIYFVNQPSK
ncbi:MAG: hypothetical protein K9J17_17795 [Flavobacteriales bacterium]|nr:hypothetical protein [Flavobacteriales bacterium]